MKKILFIALLFPVSVFGQKIVKDSIITRNDSIFTLKYQAIYEHVPDTFGLNERYLQIESIISAFRAEQESIKAKIAFFEQNKPGGLIAPGGLKRTTKQPARKPKTKRQ